jgi:hypothetical protein
MNKVGLQDIVGGQLQEKFNRAFEKVVENLQDPNTSFKVKRGIDIKLGFTQNENRDDVNVSVVVSEKLAPQQDMSTSFYIGKDLQTGEVFAEEYGKQVRGQMSLNEIAPVEQTVSAEVIDTETGEILEDAGTVVDFRKAAQ